MVIGDGVGEDEVFRMEVLDDGGAHIVRFVGELDLEHASDVAATLVRVGGSTVIADLSDLHFIDSSGIAALLTARRRLESEGNRLEIRGAAGATRRVFVAGGLADVLSD